MAAQREHKSIRYRFLKSLSGILFLSTVVLSSVIAVNEGRMLNRALITKGGSFASYIAKLSSEPLIMKDGIQLDSIVSDASKDEDILYAVIHDADGNLSTSQFASINYRSPRMKAILMGLPKESELQDMINAIRKREAVTEVSVPILSGPFKVGEVTICLSQHAIRRQILDIVLFILALNIAVAIILGYVVFSVSRQVLFEPLSELSRATDRLAKGDLTARITLQAADELQTLFDNFNRMAGDLDKTTVSKAYMDNIIEGMINTLIVADHEDKIIRANAAACSLLDYREEELKGKPIDMILAGGEAAKYSQMKTLPMEKCIGMLEAAYRAKGGQMIPMLLSASALYDKKNIHQSTVYIAQDFTERKVVEEALRDSEQKFRAITTTASDAILLMDDGGKIIYWNPAAERIFGYSAQEAIGEHLHILLSPSQMHDSYQRGFARFIETGQGAVVNKTVELTAINRDGREFPIEISTSAMNIKNRWHALGIIRDITERIKATEELKRLNEVLAYQATTDSLTGLSNRAKFSEVLGIEIVRSKRFALHLSLIIFDIDHFKKINDTYGHNSGDNVLRELAAIVSKSVRKHDLFARWGGEEFMIMLTEVSKIDAAIFAEKLRFTIEAYNFPQVGRVTCSFGVAEFEKNDTVDSFVQKADIIMYRAKSAGRNRVESS